MGLILVVDDEPMVMLVMRQGLEYALHSVCCAACEAEAYEAAEQMQRIDVLIVDHRVKPRGRNIAERILQQHPLMKVIHTSGWLRMQVEAEEGLLPGASFLPKPFTIQKMHDAVALSLAA